MWLLISTQWRVGNRSLLSLSILYSYIFELVRNLNIIRSFLAVAVYGKTFCLRRLLQILRTFARDLVVDKISFFFSYKREGSTTTDREPTDRKQTDRGQRQLAEKGDPKCISTNPRAILPKPSLCDETTVTKSSLRGQFVAVS